MAEKSESDHMPGVVRLLLEGHFKGVADVRLRINFFEELNGLQREELHAAVDEIGPSLVEEVTETVEAIVSSEHLSEEQSTSLAQQLEAFTRSVTQLLEEFTDSSDPDPEGLISGINAAFAELEAAIASLPPAEEAPATPTEGMTPTVSSPAPSLAPADAPVTPAAGETPTVPTATPSLADGAEEPTVSNASASAFNLSTFLDDLKDVFQTAMDTLKEGLNQADILPPLSEPEGRGKAYAKFLAIYQQLGGGAATEDNPEKGKIVGTYA